MQFCILQFARRLSSNFQQLGLVAHDSGQVAVSVPKYSSGACWDRVVNGPTSSGVNFQELISRSSGVNPARTRKLIWSPNHARKNPKVKLGLKNLAILPNYFGYIFVQLKQKTRLRRELSPKFLSTLGPNPTRKARPDLQLCVGRYGAHDRCRVFC